MNFLRYAIIAIIMSSSLCFCAQDLTRVEEQEIVRQLLQELQKQINENKKGETAYQSIYNSVPFFKQLSEDEKAVALAQADEIYGKKMRGELQDWISDIKQLLNNGEIQEALSIFATRKDSFNKSPILTDEQINKAIAEIDAALNEALEKKAEQAAAPLVQEPEVIDTNTPEGAQAFFRMWVRDMQKALAQKNKIMAQNLLGELNFMQKIKFLSPDDKAKARNLGEMAIKELALSTQPEAKKEQEVPEAKKMHETYTIATEDINSIPSAKAMLAQWTDAMKRVLIGFSKDEALKLLEQLSVIKESPYLKSDEKHKAITLALEVQKKYGFPQLAKKIYTQEMLEEWLQSMNYVMSHQSPRDARYLLEDLQAIQDSPQLTMQDKQKAAHKAEEVKKKYNL